MSDVEEEDPVNSSPEVSDDDADRHANERLRGVALNTARNQAKQLLRDPIMPHVAMSPLNLLYFPEEYVRPLRMCGVSKKLACLPGGRPAIDIMGCELVFVSMGEVISEHLQRVFWLMMMLNRLPDIDKCAVAVPGRTRLATVAPTGRKKDPVVVGIQELFGQAEDTLQEFINYEDWPETNEPIQSFTEFCREAYMGDEETHVSTTPVRMRLGVIPVEYVVDEEKIRTVCILLRVLPAEGYDLLRCIEEKYLARRNFAERAGGDQIRDWCDSWKRVLEYERCNNLRFQGHSVQPDAFDVRNMAGVGSACHILSPFLVFEKILNNLPGGFCGPERRSDTSIKTGTLVIGGYPRIEPGNDWVGYVAHMRAMDRAYRSGLREWRTVFREILDGGQEEGKTLPRVLYNDGVFVSLDMEVSMRFSNEAATTFAGMERVTLPKLAIACIGAFMSLVVAESEIGEDEEEGGLAAGVVDDDEEGVAPLAAEGGSLEEEENAPRPDPFLEYVRPYVEHDMEIATQFMMSDKYERPGGGSDMPEAGRSLAAQKSLQMTLAVLREPGGLVYRRVQTYLKYLITRIVIAEREEMMNVYNSVRVLETAKILQSLVKQNLCGGVADSLQFVSGRMTEERRALEQRILPFEEMVAMYEFQSAVMVYNESAKLNALNLSAYFALLVSDVLTFMGTHHSTWIFKQFTVWTLGGNGHLRSKDMIYTIKRNSSGQGFVQDAFGYTLKALALIPRSVFAEAVEFLNYFKLSRITGPQIEALAAVVTVEGKIMSVPNPLSFLRFCILDELLRNIVGEQALNTLIVHIPRDADGSNNTIKTCDPANHSMVRQAATNAAIKGCGAFYGYISTNINPSDAAKGEALKSLIVVAHPGLYCFVVCVLGCY